MLTLYPFIKKVPALVFAMALSAAGFAQSGYASNVKKSNSVEYSTTRTNAVEPFIKIKGRAENKVVLNWAPIKGDVSHYVLERSVDGRNYQEVGVLFTGEGENEPEYFFTDKFRNPYSGQLFYRLRVEGLDGSAIYTPVTILNAVVTG